VARRADAIEVSCELARALCRHAQRSPDLGLLRVGGVALDRLTRGLYFSDGRAVTLTPAECNMLHYLMERPDKHCTTSELLQHVWKYPADSAPELVRSHVSNLRKKLRSVRLRVHSQ
jgi:DNA-binding response OmpR family regulator